ncbi:MAG: hypothetical protein U5R48_13770 [Gammaproteobacteria bacterium]|nr:hypothetical protein [Gammaproteobacteria bacterium]
MRRTILLGTPNLGTVDAVRALIQGRSPGLRTIQPGDAGVDAEHVPAVSPCAGRLDRHGGWRAAAARSVRPADLAAFPVVDLRSCGAQRRLSERHGEHWTPALQAQIEATFNAGSSARASSGP